MSTVAVDQVFTALADATRRHIMELLAAEGPRSASGLAQRLPISRQAIAKHMAALEQAGLVSRIKHGKEICFQVEAHQMSATGRWMQRVAARWDPALAGTGAVRELNTAAAGVQHVPHAI